MLDGCVLLLFSYGSAAGGAAAKERGGEAMEWITVDELDHVLRTCHNARWTLDPQVEQYTFKEPPKNDTCNSSPRVNGRIRARFFCSPSKEFFYTS